MRNALTIAGKELSSYFVQPVAYVVLTVFVLLAGLFFFALLKQFSEMVQVYSAMSSTQALRSLNLNSRDRSAAAQHVGGDGDPGAGDHDARVRRGKAHRHLRVPADRADPHRRNRRRQVHRRRGLHPDHDRAHLDLPDHPDGVRRSGGRSDGRGLRGAGPAGHMLRLDRAVHVVADAEPDHRGDQLLSACCCCST